MVNNLDRQAALNMLQSLGYTQQADAFIELYCMTPQEAGAVVCFLRYGVYEAGKILCKAGIDAQHALDLLDLARRNGLVQTVNLDFAS